MKSGRPDSFLPRRLSKALPALLLLAAYLLLPAATFAHERSESAQEHRDSSHHHDASHCAICQTIAIARTGGLPPAAAAILQPLDLSPIARPVAVTEPRLALVSLDTRSSRGPPTL